MEISGKVVVAQGGGPTAVINQTLVGIILEARKHAHVTKIYGAINGVSGIINENFIDLTDEPVENLEAVALTPSAALLSSRDKPDEAYCKEMFKILQAHDVRYFFYIGGNDSSDTVRIVNQEADLANYELRAIHVPKTIDNDLVVTDHTPGFGSAARFVAQAFMGIDLDNKALPGVHVGVVMGRHAGFLTAAAAMAQKTSADGPHLIYLPERSFDISDFLDDVKEVYSKYGRCVIAVSEGLQDDEGCPIATTLGCNERDAHGNAQLSGTGVLGDLLTKCVKEQLKISKVRSDTFGYLQRSFLGCVSDVDQAEARAVGQKAVEFAMDHNVDGSVVILRTGEYSVEYKLVPLEDIAAKTKLMPDKFINKSGNHVTEEFRNYIRPLLGSDFPDYAVLNSPKVEKIIKAVN